VNTIRAVNIKTTFFMDIAIFSFFKPKALFAEL